MDNPVIPLLAPQAEIDGARNALVPLCIGVLGRDIPIPPPDAFVTYNRGCQINDMELEKERFITALAFSEPFQTADEPGCFDLDAIQRKLIPHII